MTGHGLAAQLQRLKEAAADNLRRAGRCVGRLHDGGVADHLVAAPFAVLGSIGVITEQRTVRAPAEGGHQVQHDHCRHKRTLTPTKKVEDADVRKLEQDIEQILKLFKGFVATNRPKLDIEAVATGDVVWPGRA